MTTHQLVLYLDGRAVGVVVDSRPLMRCADVERLRASGGVRSVSEAVRAARAAGALLVEVQYRAERESQSGQLRRYPAVSACRPLYDPESHDVHR